MDCELLDRHGLGRLAGELSRFEMSAIAFRLSESPAAAAATPRSRLGGLPALPRDFSWPRSKKRPLDFLLQIDLADVAPIDPTRALPSSGLLTFFYDLDNQPWGFDPKDLDGFRVELVDDAHAAPRELPDPRLALPEFPLSFHPASTLPQFGSRAYDALEREVRMTKEEADRYFDLQADHEAGFYGKREGRHRLFGHSANIQGDMQLEAQLVTNGLYCGDPSGYGDPRATDLEKGADDWVLLLQLDSDERADLMWGDAGMLYSWLRAEDLAAGRFERAWMTLQCF